MAASYKNSNNSLRAPKMAAQPNPPCSTGLLLYLSRFSFSTRHQRNVALVIIKCNDQRHVFQLVVSSRICKSKKKAKSTVYNFLPRFMFSWLAKAPLDETRAELKWPWKLSSSAENVWAQIYFLNLILNNRFFYCDMVVILFKIICN